MTVELTADEMLSDWGSAEVNDIFCQALYLKICNVVVNVRIQRTLLCQALFMDILKVPGIVRM